MHKTTPLKLLRSLFALLLAFCPLARTNAGTPNSGFAENTFITSSSLTLGTHMQWAPDGSNRLFIARKGGEIRIIKNGSLLSTPFATVSVETNGECGLDGLVLDPGFMNNGFVYAFAVIPGPKIQVIRWTASGDVGTNKTIIADNIQSAGRFHNGGGMGFGADGKLYYAVGEIETNVGGDNDLTKRNAKINRINPGGGPSLSDNPFFDGTGPNQDDIWCRGFRNPFGMTVRPGGQIWLLVVGNAWEQIFLATRGGHGGWNDFEGDQPNNGQYLIPKIKYSSHGTNFLNDVGAVCDGCFYNSTQFPSTHRGNLFFCDYTSSAVCRSSMSGDTAGSPSIFVSGAASPVDSEVGPDGALYYIQHSAGSIRRVRSTGTSQDIVVWPTWVNMREGSDHAVMVSLKVAPTSNVTVNLARTSGDSSIVVSSGAALTFTPSNFATPQKAVLHANADTDNTADTATITASATGLTSQAIAVNASDTGGTLVVSTDTITLGEGTTKTYTVKLSAQPTNNVVVTSARSAGDSSVSVTGGGSLTFTTSNWNTAQTVTITAAEDADTTTDTATVTVSATGYDPIDIAVTATDNDASNPLFTTTPPAQNDLTVGELYTYDAGASGVPTPTFSLDVAPAGMTIDANTGVINWTPTSGQTGNNPYTVRASNGVNPDATQSETLVVGNDDPPTASLTRPTDGEVVSGAGAEFYGDGIDDISTVKAEFFIDGVLQYTDNEAPGTNHFHFNGQHNAWDTTLLSDGVHTVGYQVTDTLGQVSAMVTRNVTVDNSGPATIVREAEASNPVGVGAATNVVTDTLASGGQWISLLSDTNGQAIDFTLPSVPAGTYSLTLHEKIHPNRGIVQASVNGTNVGGTFDQYAATATYSDVTIGNFTQSTTGNCVIRLTLTGKNAAAGTPNISADRFTLTPVLGNPGGTFEVENLLPPEASSGDLVHTSSEALASGGVVVIQDTNAAGDFVTFRIPNIAPGTYTVKATFKFKSSRGIVQPMVGKIGGALGNIGPAIDLYAAAESYQEITLGTWTTGATSDKQISFQITGKNASSTGFTQAIDVIKVIPQ